jgi:hypothetical protein
MTQPYTYNNQAFGAGLGLSHQPVGQAAPGFSMQQQQRYDIKATSTLGVDWTNTVPATLVIDSSRRNRDLYESPGNYIFFLQKPYIDVKTIELVSASLPNSGYSINNFNNKITFDFDNNDDGNNTRFSGNLGVGNYTITELRTEIAETMNIATDRYELNGADQKFSVDVDNKTQRLTFNTPSKVLGNDSSPNDQANRSLTIVAGDTIGIDTVIGLGYHDQTDVSNVTMPYNYLLRPTKYITMRIRDMERCDGNSTTLDGAFAVIPLDTAQNNFALMKEGDIVDQDTYIHYFNTPLPKLDRLHISFHDPKGNIYDFNGRDHFLIFKLQCLNRPLKT